MRQASRRGRRALVWAAMPDRVFVPTTEIHVWSAGLDSPAWPVPDRLPPRERSRAARIRDRRRARRWTAARWALREVLSRYLETAPAEVALATMPGGKPALAGPQPPFRFNLSHSRDMALVAVSPSREVGVDVEWIDPRRPAAFYAAWARREAVAKCLGVGLWAPAPDRTVTVCRVDAPADFAAAVAVAGEGLPPVRRLVLDPLPAQP
jgi:phosphopantetheinyl transferase (holo-ACP synthase)